MTTSTHGDDLLTCITVSPSVESACGAEKGPKAPFKACTTILVGRLASADGSVLMAHTEDMDADDVGRIYLVPSAEHDLREVIWLPWETVPQVPKTYRYWAVGNWDKTKYAGDILCGLNENGVGMCCNAIWTKDEPLPASTGLKRYSVRQLILDRATSARHAVDIVGYMVEEYGQGGTDVMDTAYCVADQNEAWVVEASARIWVARRVPDDGFLVWANEVVIEDDWDLACPRILALSKKLGKKVNFKASYGKDLGQQWNTARKARAEALLEGKIGKIAVRDLMAVLRDHFEGTDAYHEPPHGGKHCPAEDAHARPICVNETQEHIVWELKPGLPADVGAKMWFGPSSGCTGVFVPVYAGSMAVPPAYSLSEQRYSRESAWWTFETIQRLVDRDYRSYAPHVRAAWERFEAAQFLEVAAVEEKAKAAFGRGDREKGREILTSFTYKQLENALSQAERLVDWLIAQLIAAPTLPGTD